MPTETLAGPDYGTGLHAGRSRLRIPAALLAAFLAGAVSPAWPGSVVALVYVFPLAALSADQHARGWTRHAALTYALAAVAVAAIALEPGALNLAVGFFFVSAAALHSRGIAPGDMLGFVLHGARAMAGTPKAMALGAARARPDTRILQRIPAVGSIAVPVTATLVFGFLLIAANPVLEQAVWSFDGMISALLSPRALASFTVTFILAWSALRRQDSISRTFGQAEARPWHDAFFKPSTIVFTLLLLNGMFFIENVLDISHIWFLKALPAGMGHADYVHRGAYTLIITVILAAAFVMVALRPGSKTSASPAVRLLVYIFAGQNMVLVISSVLRTSSYVAAFGLTEWRLAGLIWMGLVAAGVILTAWRIFSGRDNRWLVNANLWASALVLLACGLADFRPFIANWNVDRAIAAGDGGSFDLTYNAYCLGVSALPAIERFTEAFASLPPAGPTGPGAPPSALASAAEAALLLRGTLHHQQSDWRSWTLRHSFIATEPVQPLFGYRIDLRCGVRLGSTI
jgi:hypothetical protein